MVRKLGLNNYFHGKSLYLTSSSEIRRDRKQIDKRFFVQHLTPAVFAHSSSSHLEMESTTDDDDDVQIVKVVPKPKMKTMTWVSSSFDGFSMDLPPTNRSLSTPKADVNARSEQQQEKWGASESQKRTQPSISAFTSMMQSRKRHREPVHRLSSQIQTQSQHSLKAAINTELWSEKYKPSIRAELAVHKKKVNEVADWLKDRSQHISPHAAPILLLTGPPGAGKTACVNVLCAELGLDLHEWFSSSEQAADRWSSEDFRSHEKSEVDVYMSQSQSSVFHNFLLRANKYHALDFLGSAVGQQKHHATSSNNNKSCRSVIVVEDIPNVFFRDTSQFHDILRKYRYSGHSPLVFIMSESNNNSASIQKLFPTDLQQQLNITNISMNPVAPTMLTKLLNRVVTRESGQSKFSPPSASVIETVAMSSSGDIRSALNTIQFACRRDTEDLKALCKPPSRSHLKKQGSGSRLKYTTGQRHSGESNQPEDSASALGVKDKAVFLFHAIGKILYFKRGDPRNFPEHPILPEHLQKYDRDPLLLDPEEVAHQSHLPGDYFNSFLQENYVEFLSSVEDLERAAEYFSDSDYVSSLWTAREELQNYQISIATRGFIHSNSEYSRHDSSRKNQGWRPLHKSQWFNASKQATENITTARQLFRGYHWEPEVLCTEIMPYINLTNPTLHDAGQITFVQEMTQFSQFKQFSRSKLERLDEKDVVEDDENKEEESIISVTESHTKGRSITEMDGASAQNVALDDGDGDDSLISSSQTKVQDLETEDDIVIEDFDDEF